MRFRTDPSVLRAEATGKLMGRLGHGPSAPLASRHHLRRGHRQRRAWLWLFVDHRPDRPPVSDQPGAEPRAGADRSGAQRLRAVGESRIAAERVATGLPHRDRTAAWRHRRDGDGVASQPGLAEILDVSGAAPADSAAGRGLSPAAQVRTIDRPWLRRRGRGALLRDDDLGSTAGGDAQQSGLHQARFPRGAGVHQARGIIVHGGRVPHGPVCTRWKASAWSPTSSPASRLVCRLARR